MDIKNQRSKKKHTLYFIAAPSVGRIKIGITADSERRLANLQASSPVELVLLLTVRGTARQEWALLGKFDAHRVHGEWFDMHEDISSFVDELRMLDERGQSRRLRRLRVTVPSGRWRYRYQQENA